MLKFSRDLSAARYLLTERSRSSGWTRATQSCSICSSRESPVKSSHGLLKNVQRPSMPDIQIIMGAVSSKDRKCCSLSSDFVAVFCAAYLITDEAMQSLVFFNQPVHR